MLGHIRTSSDFYLYHLKQEHQGVNNIFSHFIIYTEFLKFFCKIEKIVSVYLTIYHFVSLSVCLSVCLSFPLYVCLPSFCLSVYVGTFSYLEKARLYIFLWICFILKIQGSKSSAFLRIFAFFTSSRVIFEISVNS